MVISHCNTMVRSFFHILQFATLKSDINCDNSVFTTVALPLHSRFNITVYVGDLNNENTTFPQFRTGLPNSPPLLQPLAVSMEEDTSLLLDISITDSEGDVVQLYVVTNPLHGRLYQWSPSGVRGSTIDANSTQVLVTDSQHRILYVPFSNYFGGDNFLILAKDNQNETSPIQSVNITISSIPDPPVVVSDDLYMDEDSVIAVQFRAIDPDDTDNLNICILSLPSAGILLVQNSTQPNAGNLTITNVPYTLPQNTSTAYFIPAKDENGTPYSSLKFKANDGQMDSLSNGTVNIYVRPVNDAPIFNRTSLNLTVYEDTPVIFQFNISDVDEEDTLSIRISDLRLQGDLYVSSSPDDLKDIAKFKDIAPLGEGSEIRNPPFRLLFVPRLNFYSADFDSATGQRINLTYADGKSSFSEEIAFSILPVNDPPKLSCDYPFIELPAQFTTGGSAAHEIQFTVTDVDDRNFTFTLIDAPPVGFLFHGSNDSIIQPGEKFDGSSVLYNSNSSGGRYPFGNFTVSVQDMNGRKSNSCTYTFSFTCPPGKYNNIFKTTGPICDACPEGAICSPDGSQPVRPALGFWRSDQNTTYLPCLPREACPGYAENTCALGYEGTRCGQCSRHYYRFNNSCQKCDDSNLSLSLAVIGGALAAALLFFAVFKYVIGGGPRFGIISILINFIQTILLLQLMRLNWPSEFHEVLNRLSFLNFNIELTSPECFVSDQYLNFSLKMRLSLLIPFVILGLSAVAPMFDYILQILEQYWRRKRDTPVFQPLLMFRVFNSGLAVAFVHITSNALALFDCSYEDDGYSYLDADTSLRCYEEWWVQDLPIAAIATCAYVIGVPLYFAIICYNARKCSQDPSRATRFSQFCNSILSYDNSYQTKFQYFTVFQLLQKLFMVLISTFFTRYTGLQIILTLSLLFVSFQFLREYSPYSYKRLNHLEALSHVCAMIVLALGLPFHLDQFRSSVYQQILMVLIILVVCSFIVFTILVCVYDAIQFFRHRSSSKVEVQAKSGMLR